MKLPYRRIILVLSLLSAVVVGLSFARGFHVQTRTSQRTYLLLTLSNGNVRVVHIYADGEASNEAISGLNRIAHNFRLIEPKWFDWYHIGYSAIDGGHRIYGMTLIPLIVIGLVGSIFWRFTSRLFLELWRPSDSPRVPWWRRWLLRFVSVFLLIIGTVAGVLLLKQSIGIPFRTPPLHRYTSKFTEIFVHDGNLALVWREITCDIPDDASLPDCFELAGFKHCLERTKVIVPDGPSYILPDRYNRSVTLPLPLITAVSLSWVLIAFLIGPLRRVWWPDCGHCRNCRYDLTGNTSGVCPECGLKYRSATESHASSL